MQVFIRYSLYKLCLQCISGHVTLHCCVPPLAYTVICRRFPWCQSCCEENKTYFRLQFEQWKTFVIDCYKIICRRRFLQSVGPRPPLVYRRKSSTLSRPQPSDYACCAFISYIRKDQEKVIGSGPDHRKTDYELATQSQYYWCRELAWLLIAALRKDHWMTTMNQFHYVKRSSGTDGAEEVAAILETFWPSVIETWTASIIRESDRYAKTNGYNVGRFLTYAAAGETRAARRPWLELLLPLISSQKH